MQPLYVFVHFGSWHLGVPLTACRYRSVKAKFLLGIEAEDVKDTLDFDGSQTTPRRRGCQTLDS